MLQIFQTLALILILFAIPGHFDPQPIRTLLIRSQFLVLTEIFHEARQDKTRQDKIYFESARHITINISSRALLNRLFEKHVYKIIICTAATKKKQFVIFKHQT